MPYCELDYQCRSCICPSCSLFQTEGCLEDKDGCDRCNNEAATSYCPWHDDEN
jgi:hypothetical protein